MAFFGFGSPSFGVIDEGRPIMSFRQGSNECDSSCSRERSSPVMLSAAKHLAADRDRPFASLRVTWCDESNCQGLFFTIEPCLNKIIRSTVGADLSRPPPIYRPRWILPIQMDKLKSINSEHRSKYSFIEERSDHAGYHWCRDNWL